MNYTTAARICQPIPLQLCRSLDAVELCHAHALFFGRQTGGVGKLLVFAQPLCAVPSMRLSLGMVEENCIKKARCCASRFNY